MARKEKLLTEERYLGRIVAIGKTELDQNVGMYRISSRSFPNREIIEADGSLIVVPREGFEKESLSNPYVSYSAIECAGEWIVVSNGSHTRFIADKLADQVDPVYALATVLANLGYERDGYNTPRIAGVVPRTGSYGWLAIAMIDGLIVQKIELKTGYCNYISTNYQTIPSPVTIFEPHSVDQIGRFLIEDRLFFRTLKHPVASAAAVYDGKSLRFSTHRA